MASAYLSRTPSSAGNRKTWTWSGWVKLFKGNSQLILFSEQTNSYPTGGLYINGQQEIRLYFGTASNSFQCAVDTDAKYRDVSGWYHIVCAVDTTQVTDSDRVKFYVNGVLQTELNGLTSSGAGSSDPLYPSQNYDCLINTANVHYIGGDNNYSADCSMTHVHFIDGTQYQASNFGETDSTTGIWKPKTAPSVTYGTNGFFLKFENSGAFGTDSSGNSNNFTVNGTMTQTIDTPSNVFNVLNAVSNPPNGYTLSNGNLEATVSGSSFVRTFITNTIAPTSGKWYWESKLITSGGTDRSSIGICSYDENIGTGTTIPQNELSICTGFSRIRFTENGSTTEVDSFYTVPSANDIFMYALDLDNTKFYFGVNGNWWNYNSSETGGDPTSGSGYVTNSTNIIKGAMSAFLRVQAGAVSTTFTNQFNFGNGYFGTTAVSSAQNPDDGIGIFEYDVPTGYRALCTKSINAEEYD